MALQGKDLLGSAVLADQAQLGVVGGVGERNAAVEGLMHDYPIEDKNSAEGIFIQRSGMVGLGNGLAEKLLIEIHSHSIYIPQWTQQGKLE
jgi:hypothetical protein